MFIVVKNAKKRILEYYHKEKFEALLNHFSDQIEIKDGKVIDPFGGIRPVEICLLGDE